MEITPDLESRLRREAAREGLGVGHHPIPSAPLAGRGGARRAWALAVIGAGTLVAAARLLWLRPHLVLLTGGFAAAPVVLAACLLRPLTGLRIAIFEPNAVPGGRAIVCGERPTGATSTASSCAWRGPMAGCSTSGSSIATS